MIKSVTKIQEELDQYRQQLDNDQISDGDRLFNIQEIQYSLNKLKKGVQGKMLMNVLKYMCANAGVTIHDLKYGSREKRLVDVRAIVMYILRYEFNMTLTRIAFIFNKHHSTVHHLINKHKQYVDIYDDYKQKYLEVRGKLI
jgi:chromosomal replication initiation ATPase DnaA